MLALTKVLISAAILAGSVTAAPQSSGSKGYNPFPLKDGFPSPSAKQLKNIERAAGGSLPNGGLPTKLTDTATLIFQLISAQETFEVAYFNSLLTNVTNGVPGYKLPKGDRAEAIKIFSQIRAQEELHAIGANAILANAGREPIEPCKYTFPVSDFASAVGLANTFTDLVLSVLPLTQVQFAVDGGQETGLIQLVGSIIAQEGEQNGFFRFAGGKVPSAAPFLTASNPLYAYNALLNFIVPGSCPNIENLMNSIPTIPGVTVVSTGKAPHDTTGTYSVKFPVNAKTDGFAYMSGQNVPVVVKICNVKKGRGGVYTFQAALPFDSQGFAQGLTVGAVVKGFSGFATNADVAAKTIAGPALVEVL